MTNRRSTIAGILLGGAWLFGAGTAKADCPPVPTAAQTADPYAGQAPPRPNPVTDTTRAHVENEEASYCLYSPPPTTVPLGMILYAHGAQLSEQGALDPMLQWLGQTGFYVVYPYVSDATHYPTLARDALSHAIAEVAKQGVAIQHVAVAGHALGALAAVRVAAIWDRAPAIRAIVLHEPAGLDSLFLLDTAGEYDFSPEALASIPCSTRLLVIQAESSVGLPSSAAVPIWNALPQIARYTGTSGTAPNRNFLRVPHDRSHQRIAPFVTIPSTHDAATAFPVTSMDWHGYWLPMFGAIWEAFYIRPFWGYSSLCNSSSTTGSCSLTRDMGTWALDGVPATKMRNAADLGLLESVPSYCSP